MNIFIAGLGLIGGSFAKAIKKYTSFNVFGFDIDKTTIEKSKSEKLLDRGMDFVDTEILLSSEIIIVALNYDKAIDFVKTYAEYISQNTIVVDICGVKKVVCDELESVAKLNGFTFVGGHPMAGREFSGYDASSAELFTGASMLLTTENTVAINKLEKIFLKLGFGKIIITTPEKHDAIIAYTSQLAHIASNAFIKSPTADLHCGFSAGSFRDLTRVAYLNEEMWSGLFLANAENLISELDIYINNLKKYREVLKESDDDALRRLLKDGKERKTKAFCDGE